MNGLAKKRFKEIEYPFTCPVTFRKFNSGQGLACYITKTLKLDHKLYYDKYINHRDKACFFCGQEGLFISVSKGYRNLCENNECLKKSFASSSVEGIMYKLGCNQETAEKILADKNQKNGIEIKKAFEKLREKNPSFDKERSRNCIEFWQKKGFSLEESKLKAKSVMDEIHRKNSIKFKNDPEKYASKYPTKIEYYLKKGISKEDAIKIISENQSTFSLKKCILKYGVEKGTEIWQKRQDCWQKSLDSKTDEEKIQIRLKKLFNRSGYSKISQKLFWEISNNYPDNEIFFEEKNKEIIRYNKTANRAFRIDYLDSTLKKVIEFNGDFWHCNPEKFDENYNHRVMKKTASEIWALDKEKKDWLTNHGYNVLVIWESEYRKDPSATLEKCLRFLNE